MTNGLPLCKEKGLGNRRMPVERTYLDHNATAPLRPAAREAMVAALKAASNPSSVHGEGRDARRCVAKVSAHDWRGPATR
jgi:hypothetical protein